MKFWGSNNIKNRVKFSVLLNIFTYFLLIWIPNNDLCNADKNIEKQYKREGIMNISKNRLLAKHEIPKNMKYPPLRNKLSDDVNNMNLTYRKNNISTYDQLNKKSLNDLDAYKKGYKNRYSKKKGLGKLDCYCEKKIFNKIDKIYELSRSMQNDKKNFKKKIYNKFGYGLILFALFPIFGIIIPILFNENGPLSYWCTSECKSNNDPHPHDGIDNCYRSQFSKEEWESFFCINRVFSFTLIIIFLIVVLYTLIKVVKYERLKAGKAKIKGRDYYRFCKNVFI